MGKVIMSPVEKFSGTVTLVDPVPYPAFIEWEKRIGEAGAVQESKTQLVMFEAVGGMIEAWNIADFDIKKPRATPRAAVLELLAWLVTEIGKVINGTDPN